ncbi:MAG: MBL fold metallo-hydrolase [Planctomycetales bacterium]|nr:MBL fold metallo-hydrolase [Planctomycetales bacterium]NIM09318.1 MBL fold metallo-hydrolase [Planctomycetales bacterium]NIN08786.1 MBL fold metallo-hydrolase [Planctomycetales bacterium]NIN77903.1 MBL fold metallo-hydrolase [Planctomycetales bacterium]NIO35086.1 MBL fold metallo-hydrolase [Planctomycetales bacterium]
MKLHFWGAAGTVTGSMHLVQFGRQRMLLDCGLYQGRRKEAFERNREIPFDAEGVGAVVLSHAHIDHCGNLPSLVRAGFDGPIYCTSATRDVAARMLLDSAKIQESDVAYVNKRRRRKRQTPFEPLYSRRDVSRTIQCFVPVDYERSFHPLEGVRGAFRDAGHMLGSASVELDIATNGRSTRLVFSGDIGRHDLPILRDPQVPSDAEFIIMESTYGDRLHAERQRTVEILLQVSARTIQNQGKLIIPAFSVGRTQEVVYHLNQLWNEGRLAKLPVYVDSPLAVDATDVYRAHPECYDEQMVDALFDETDKDPLGFRDLRYVRSSSESKKLNELAGPAVIISASGMCEGGRILHHLKHHIEDPATTILFAGYQAPHTLGRKILDGMPEVPILGRRYRVRAEVEKIEGCSAHADREGLIGWARQAQAAGRVRKIFLVHGEPEAASSLAEELAQQLGAQVEIPARGDTFQLG